MKAVSFDVHGDVDVLQWREWPDPSPEADEAVIKVQAAALNAFDGMILQGIPTLKTPLPMIPGGDVAGLVVEVGGEASAAGWKPGDRVLVNPLQPGRGMMGETLRGVLCEYVAVPARYLIRLPADVGAIDAAALPVAYGTAHRMMKRAGLKAGDRVLILGATGGVGVACLQLAKLAGAEVAACTTSAKKAQRLLEIGADHVIDTGAVDLVDAVVGLWGKPRVYGESGGADIVVNYIGGESWARSLRTVRRDGRLVTCGATAGYDPQTDLRYIWSLELNIIGCNGWESADLDALLDDVASDRLKPVIDSVRPMSATPAAMRALLDRDVIGKAVLVP